MTFGRSLGTACALDQPGRAFAPDVVVWWRADLTQVMAADAAVVVVTFKGSNQIDYQYVPPDPSAGRWQVFCSGPVEGSDAGGYAVELWNAERSRLLARGEFTRIGPRATATPAAAGTFHGAGSPGATQAAALAGSVSFGTFFRNP